MNTAREIRNIWDEIGRMKTRTAGSASGAVVTFLGLNDTPAAYAGAALQNVRVNAATNALEFAAGGDVVGPVGATDEALARYDLATGKLIQDSNAILSDAGELSLAGALFIAEIATPVARANYGAIYPKNDNALYFQDGAGVEHTVVTGVGGGDVVGPAASTDNALARFHLATGKIIQNSNAILNDAGLLFLADTANTMMTIGLTINQGGADDEIAAYKSSDVAHGCTTLLETDTYLCIRKYNPNEGGGLLRGASETGVGLSFQGLFTSNTTSFGGEAGVHIEAYKISGAGLTNSDADQTLLSIRTYIAAAFTTIFGVNASGQTWQKGTGWINETSNAFMTVGQTINQGAADDEIVALKSTDVNHGITTYAETDTYGTFSKISAASGGLDSAGFSAGSMAFRFLGRVTTNNTTRGTTGLGIHHLYGAKKSGTTEGNVDAGTNIVSIACFTGGALPAVWLVDNTGATWQSGTAWINETSNADMTTGITVQQGGADDEILALKSTDVAHGCTTRAETDTYYSIRKVAATEGGGYVRALGSGTRAYVLQGFFASDTTTKTTASNAAINFTAMKISGTGYGNCAADQNVFAIRASRNGAVETVFIVDEDGDVYYNGALVSYDDYDDALACRDAKNVLSNGMAPVLYNQEKLIKMGIISKGGFISNKGMTALMLGAISQLYEENKGFKKQIAALAA